MPIVTIYQGASGSGQELAQAVAKELDNGSRFRPEFTLDLIGGRHDERKFDFDSTNSDPLSVEPRVVQFTRNTLKKRKGMLPGKHALGCAFDA
jgi:hypothetical protein